jgi:hypothetical protein
VVVVDDVALLDAASPTAASSGAAGALSDLARLLPWSELLNLHLIVVRTPGAGRSGFDPLATALRSAGATELLLAGDHDGLGRRLAKPLLPGRGTLLQQAESAVPIQCFLES